MPIPFDRHHLHLYVVTERAALRTGDLCEAVRAAVAGGATLVQYREKHLDRNTMYTNALQLRALTRDLHVPFVVNDYVDLALAVEADGVHLGQTDLPLAAAREVAGDRLWYGCSTHSAAQAHAACTRDVPDYVAIGPVFPTATKTNPDPVVGLEGVRAVRAALPDIPLVGIGGITPDTAPAVRAAGADGVCVIRAVWSAPDITAACRALA